jgi:hypothetical protein
MLASIQVTDRLGLFTYLTLTDHWYESKNYWRLSDGYTHKLKYGKGEYERTPGSFLHLYGYGSDASLVRVMRLDLKPGKYPFERGYKNTGEIYKEAALEAEAGKIEYEVIWVS